MRRKTHTPEPGPAAERRRERIARPRHRRRFVRWRILSLSLVYLVFAAHIIHWKMTGRTLAPLELNEVMYTLELGIITAGFLFMCVLVLGTLIFGRFFCSWACHIMVLQDLCAGLLARLGIRRKPIRSRLLLFVPPLTAFYMFIWPQILRVWHNGALPTFHMRTDAEGWASFVTNNFWRNLPSPPIIVLTFLVCGFLIVFLLGSRTFCTYVCPYGSIFALADRFSPGRIRVNDKCVQCGTCTSACSSGVRVHDEIQRHGMIVNPACLKDLDCISVCPQSALRYSFTRPALFGSLETGGRFGGQPYDFTLAEELLMSVVFVFIVLAFRGLYSRIPFLLSLAMGTICAYFAVTALRLARRPGVMLASWPLKDAGRFTGWGRAYAAFVTLLAIFVGHSAFIRWHEYLGLTQTRALNETTGVRERDELAARALGHLRVADTWGLMHNERVEHSLIDAAFQLHRYDDVEQYAGQILLHSPGDSMVLLRMADSLAARGRTTEAEQQYRALIDVKNELTPQVLASVQQSLGELLARTGRFTEAADAFRSAIAQEPGKAAAHAELGSTLAELGQFDAAISSLREAVRIEPTFARGHYNLGTILARKEQFREAVACYQLALKAGLEDSDVHNNLGFALLETGQFDESRIHLERAIAIDFKNANAHFNLGNLYAARQDVQRASEQFRIAASLDPRLARVLMDRATQGS